MNEERRVPISNKLLGADSQNKQNGDFFELKNKDIRRIGAP